MLTLITYPAVDYTSYTTLVDADNLLEYHVDNYLWVALNNDDKMRYLTKAFNEINALDGFIQPDNTIPDDIHCLPDAQALIAIHYLITKDNRDQNRIKSEKVGPMTVSYATDINTISILTDEIRRCLSEFGALFDNTSALSWARKVR